MGVILLSDICIFLHPSSEHSFRVVLLGGILLHFFYWILSQFDSELRFLILDGEFQHLQYLLTLDSQPLFLMVFLRFRRIYCAGGCLGGPLYFSLSPITTAICCLSYWVLPCALWIFLFSLVLFSVSLVSPLLLSSYFSIYCCSVWVQQRHIC